MFKVYTIDGEFEFDTSEEARAFLKKKSDELMDVELTSAEVELLEKDQLAKNSS